MCGLVGFLNFDRRFDAESGQKIVREMAEAIHYRGPDMDGYWASEDNRCHLGHKRLSIIDLSEGGRQPMLDDSGRYVIVFNGEIYNFQELREKLEAAGIRFRTRTDTEVLLKGYIKYGAALFPQLDGMFALAIYDTAERTMILARDRAGEKPLYYRSAMGLFLFASELHALTRMPGLDWDISPGAVALYMLYRYVPAPQSILEGVRKLKPGCLLTVDAKGKTHERRYYAFEVDPEAEATQEGFLQTCERVEAAMVESLRRRLISDVPLGMFLSSGVDSSLVCTLAVKKLGITPRTFTIGFDGDNNSEHLRARDTARHLGTEHTDHLFTASDFDKIGSKIGALLDEPNGDRSCVPTYMLCAFAREQVTVAISGDGGDEMFAGYGRYGPMDSKFKNNTADRARLVVESYYDEHLPVFGSKNVMEVFPESASAIDQEFGAPIPLFQHPGRNVIQGLRQLDFAQYMSGAVLAKVDRMSMRSSLEVRTPFFSPSLLDESTRLPTEYCKNANMRKLVLREITARNLPEIRDTVALSANKLGFGMPPAVLVNNRERLRIAIGDAHESLRQLRFFKERPCVLARMWQVVKSCVDTSPEILKENQVAMVQYMNAPWAFVVFGQWAADFPVRL